MDGNPHPIAALLAFFTLAGFGMGLVFIAGLFVRTSASTQPPPSVADKASPMARSMDHLPSEGGASCRKAYVVNV